MCSRSARYLRSGLFGKGLFKYALCSTEICQGEARFRFGFIHDSSSTFSMAASARIFNKTNSSLVILL